MPDSQRPISSVPTWLTTPERYRPGNDRDGFIAGTMLSLSSAVAFFRLDEGREARFSPSARIKLLLCLLCILLVSLSRNMLFVMVVLAGVLLRACLLPQRALSRMVHGSVTAALLMLALSLPAALFGQPKSALSLALKALVCTGMVLTVALTTPPSDLTGALRSLGLPDIVILTIDLTLRSIVALGTTALEALTALRLRSVGTNRQKRAAIGGVGGVVLLKASLLAQDTHDAMRCRGFDGTYRTGHHLSWRAIDWLWLALAAAMACLFAYLQGAV